MTKVQSTSEFINEQVHDFITSPSKIKKSLKFAVKVFKLSDNNWTTTPIFTKPIEWLGYNIKSLELCALYGDVMFWKNYFIRPVKYNKLNQDQIFNIFKSAVQAKQSALSDAEIKDKFKTIYASTFDGKEYWNSSDFINAFNSMVSPVDFGINEDINDIDNNLQSSFKRGLEQEWSTVYKSMPICEVLKITAFTYLDVVIALSVIQEFIPFAEIAASMGKYGQVFIYIGTIPLKPLLSPIACVGLLFAVIESSRCLGVAIIGSNKIEIWNASWDLLVSSSTLAVEITALIIPVTRPGIAIVDVIACGIGISAFIAKPAFKYCMTPAAAA